MYPSGEWKTREGVREAESSQSGHPCREGTSGNMQRRGTRHLQILLLTALCLLHKPCVHKPSTELHKRRLIGAVQQPIK